MSFYASTSPRFPSHDLISLHKSAEKPYERESEGREIVTKAKLFAVLTRDHAKASWPDKFPFLDAGISLGNDE